jgi:hypothetical protein
MGEGEEYTEHKVRVYKTVHQKGEGRLSKYFVKPISKALGHKPHNDSASRLTA